MYKILITGGAGFIGSHTCLTLLENNYEVVVIDSFENATITAIKRVIEIAKTKIPEAEKNLKIYNGDIRDSGILENIFNDALQSKNPIISVIHFAGLKAVSESTLRPLDYWDVNVSGTLKLLKVMEEHKCTQIVFSSSASIYGSSSINLIDETSEIKPVNPYANTKATIERILKDLYLSNSTKWKIANLRYFNPIGAHCSGLIGEDPRGKANNIFPYITQVAIGRKEKLSIFGSDWPTKDGTGVRDYIHVMDLAEGHLAAMKYLNENKPEVIDLNLGTGIGTSVLNLIDTFEVANKCKIPYIFTGRRPGDVASLVASNSLALNKLKWEPKRSLLEMCKDGFYWQKLNPNGYLKD